MNCSIYSSMKFIDEIVSQAPGSLVAEQIKAISLFYENINEDFAPFQEEFGIHCPEGCGDCCKHFVPDLTSSEALIIAAYMKYVQKREDIAELLKNNLDNTLGPCPLYRDDSPFHCTVYPSRGLICRLFGNCASDTKRGVEFKRCRFNKEPDIMPERLTSEELSKAQHKVPRMEEYGMALENLDGNDSRTELLPLALLRALSRLDLLESLSKK